MINRMVRAFRNDLTLYPELKESEDASSEGYQVILLIAVVVALIDVIFDPSLGYFIGFLFFFVILLVGYAIVLVTAYVISKVGRGEGTFGQLHLALAYGYTPAILSSIPWIGILFSLWLLVTISSAIRETMGIGKGLTFFIVIFAIVVTLLLPGIIFSVLITPFFL